MHFFPFVFFFHCLIDCFRISGVKAFEGDEQEKVIRINRECSINFSLCKTASPEGKNNTKNIYI